jgi:hypothetical protein
MPGRGQDLPLLVEPPHNLLSLKTALEELQRHLLLELAVSPLRQVDHRHAAAPHLPDNTVAAHRGPGEPITLS